MTVEVAAADRREAEQLVSAQWYRGGIHFGCRSFYRC